MTAPIAPLALALQPHQKESPWLESVVSPIKGAALEVIKSMTLDFNQAVSQKVKMAPGNVKLLFAATHEMKFALEKALVECTFSEDRVSVEKALSALETLSAFLKAEDKLGAMSVLGILEYSAVGPSTLALIDSARKILMEYTLVRLNEAKAAFEKDDVVCKIFTNKM